MGFFDAEGEIPLTRQGSGYKIWLRFHHSWNGNNCLVLEQIKEILEKDFSIQSGRISGPKKEKNFPSFDLILYGDDVLKFMKEIGTSHPKHIRRLHVMIEGTHIARSLAN